MRTFEITVVLLLQSYSLAMSDETKNVEDDISTEKSHKTRRELIHMTQNSLNQARFFELRRAPQNAKFEEKPFTKATVIPRLIEPPQLICGHGLIGVRLHQPFVGRIYAGGKSDDEDCVQFVTENEDPMFVTALNSSCGVRSSRKTSSQSALEYHLRVVVSFGFEHLTEDDRIFELTCAYSIANQTVDAFYDTVNIQRRPITNNTEMPKCRYSLHKNSLQGPKTRSVRVGELVYHRWSCPSEEYMFKVYRCYVHNGISQSYLIIDDDGCSLDEEIIPHPEYDSEHGIVFTPAKAFRFSKSRRVHFNCLLSVCHKWDERCMKDIPPKCGRSQKKRQLPSNISIEERLTRIHNLINNQNYGERMKDSEIPSGTITLSSDRLFIESAEEEECAEVHCPETPWISILFLTNATTALLACIAWTMLIRNRYTLEIHKIRKAMVDKLPIY